MTQRHLQHQGMMGDPSFFHSHAGDPGLLSARGDPSMLSLSSGTPSTSLLYEQYLMGDQGSLRQQMSSEAFPYEMQSMDQGRGLNLYNSQLTQHLPPDIQRFGQMMPGSQDYPGSAMSMSDIARIPSQARGMEPFLPQYADSISQGRAGFPFNYAAGMEASYMDPMRNDSTISQRYPLTSAALGLDRSHMGLDLERSQIGRELMLEQGRQMMEQGRQLIDSSRFGHIPRPNSNAITLYMNSDEETLSQYQCVVRKQIELFAAETVDVETNAQGRNKPIVLGQVGIRCLHCASIHPKHRARGGTYYPSKLSGFYQAAQNMASAHLCEHCTHVPHPLRRQLLILRERKSSAGGGKDYWADSVKALGVIEDKERGILRFKDVEEDDDDEPERNGNADAGET
jgi:hypothetical protein